MEKLVCVTFALPPCGGETTVLFLALALIALALVVVVAKLPQLLNTEAKTNYAQALKDKKLKLGAIGIFLYVGAEVAIGSYAVNYFLNMNLAETILSNSTLSWVVSQFHSDISAIDAKAVVATFLVFYWGGAMIGRFIGSYLTRIYKPNVILGLFSVFAIACIVLSMVTNGVFSMWSILVIRVLVL